MNVKIITVILNVSLGILFPTPEQWSYVWMNMSRYLAPHISLIHFIFFVVILGLFLVVMFVRLKNVISVLFLPLICAISLLLTCLVREYPKSFVTIQKPSYVVNISTGATRAYNEPTYLSVTDPANTVVIPKYESVTVRCVNTVTGTYTGVQTDIILQLHTIELGQTEPSDMDENNTLQTYIDTLYKDTRGKIRSRLCTILDDTVKTTSLPTLVDSSLVKPILEKTIKNSLYVSIVDTPSTLNGVKDNSGYSVRFYGPVK